MLYAHVRHGCRLISPQYREIRNIFSIFTIYLAGLIRSLMEVRRLDFFLTYLSDGFNDFFNKTRKRLVENIGLSFQY